MKNYILADKKNWKGRETKNQGYLHEKIKLVSIKEISFSKSNKIALLGYCCDEGVRRNGGRVGAVLGPDAIRKQLGKLPNHLQENTDLVDLGNLACPNDELSLIQNQLRDTVTILKENNWFPIILGGGHDLAYGHFKGLTKNIAPTKTVGIINFDAHFDLRDNEDGNNSGTPFFQIIQEYKEAIKNLKYICAGVRKDANDTNLFKTADEFGVFFLERNYFSMYYLEHVQLRIMQFLEDVDYVYTTIDLDGFSSAFAPGVSAPSPMGFSPDIVLECLKLILESGKLIGMDVVELNPNYDIDDQTAKLAASLIHYTVHQL